MNDLFDDFDWHGRSNGESYDEYRSRVKRENQNIKYYRQYGNKLKGDKLGSQRRRFLNKKVKRGTIEEVNRK